MQDDLTSRIQELARICRERDWKVGLAESCTGGLLSSWLTTYPGVSAFYQGTVVSYSGLVKERILNVPHSTIQAHGEVSVEVALAMAKGAQTELSCDWSVSITGIAGPSGGTPDKPVGTVCFAAVGPGFEKAVQQRFAAGSGRQDIQRQAALFAFDFLLSAMR